jgi:hypothetical protein
MKKLILSSLVLCTFIMFFFLGACKKADVDITESLGNDNGLAEQSFNDVSQMNDEAYEGSLNSFKTGEVSDIMGGLCDTVIVDTIARIITIDFGSSNCMCADGKNRRGKVIINYTGRYKDAGSVHTITFDNYYVNDNKIEGTKTVTNMGMNTDGNYYYTISVTGNIIKADGSGTISWVSNRVRTWLNGYSTPTRADDKYSITGDASGTTAGGDAFTATISSALTIDMSCVHKITAGSIIFSKIGGIDRSINFGTGTCDNTFTISARGRTRTLTFR